MTEEYALKAENTQGIVVILPRRFSSKSEVEDHHVKLSQWRRVWIERVEIAENRQS